MTYTKNKKALVLIFACMWDTASVCPSSGHVTNRACDFTETGIEKNDFHTHSTVWHGTVHSHKKNILTDDRKHLTRHDMLSWPIPALVHRKSAVSCSDWLLERSCLVRMWRDSSWTRRKEKKCQWNVLLVCAKMSSIAWFMWRWMYTQTILWERERECWAGVSYPNSPLCKWPAIKTEDTWCQAEQA